MNVKRLASTNDDKARLFTESVAKRKIIHPLTVDVNWDLAWNKLVERAGPDTMECVDMRPHCHVDPFSRDFDYPPDRIYTTHQVEIALVNFGQNLNWQKFSEEKDRVRREKGWNSDVFGRELISVGLQYPSLALDLGIERMVIASSLSCRHNDCVGSDDDYYYVFLCFDEKYHGQNQKRYVFRSTWTYELLENLWLAFLTKPR